GTLSPTRGVGPIPAVGQLVKMLRCSFPKADIGMQRAGVRSVLIVPSYRDLISLRTGPLSS
ncbi:hypothetical protein, partial [Ruegeria haliotis]|uniref:hypothetical protein n=1 Tax=Ruegeria haliotis TaxID=2747601 RepID=UPI001B7D8333